MTETSSQPLGVITAIPEEIAHFGDHFEATDPVELGGFLFRPGRLDGRAAVLVETGIGKVNAAIVTTVLLRRFGCRGLVFSGVAGGLAPDLSVGDVVIGQRVVCHDYGAVTNGALKPYQPGAFPLPGLPDAHGYDLPAPLVARLREALTGLELPSLSARATGGAPRTPKLHFGTILTGDAFINCADTRQRLHAGFGGHAVEMEGAAVHQVAERFAVPAVVVRALSDLAGEDSHMDFESFLPEAAGIAARIVRHLAPVL